MNDRDETKTNETDSQVTGRDRVTIHTENNLPEIDDTTGESQAEEPGKPNTPFTGVVRDRFVLTELPAEPINLNDKVSEHVDQMIRAERRTPERERLIGPTEIEKLENVDLDEIHDRFVAPHATSVPTSGDGFTHRRDGSRISGSQRDHEELGYIHW